jgi:hypothetical protein
MREIANNKTTSRQKTRTRIGSASNDLQFEEKFLNA